MPLPHFNLREIRWAAVELARVLHANLRSIEALDTPRECYTEPPDKDAIETAFTRVVMAIVPLYPDHELTEALIRDLTTPETITEKGLSQEERERMTRVSRLLRDCECAAGNALLEIVHLLHEWLNSERINSRGWIQRFAKAVGKLDTIDDPTAVRTEQSAAPAGRRDGHAAPPSAQPPSTTAAAGPETNEGDRSAALESLRWKAEAMLLVKAEPHLSDAEIARRVGRHPGTLSRCKAYQIAASMARGGKTALPKGHIEIDTDTGKRKAIEAYTEDNPEDDD
jgi:hypothetical protein